MQDITKAIHADRVDGRELAHLLLNRFGEASYTAIDQIDMPNSGAPSLTLRYTKKGAVAQVVASLSSAVIAEIADEVECTLLAPTRARVSRKIVFSQVPTTGWWACSAFRIAPPPDNAPPAPFFIADHPLVMEVRFEAVEDAMFSMQRAHRLQHEYSLLLSLFAPKINHEPKQTLGSWGQPIPRNPTEPVQPQWFQNSYFLDGFVSMMDDYPEVTSEPIALVPNDKYYARPWISTTDALTLPQSISPWIEGYLAGPEEIKRRLLRSAYWISHASQMFSVSQSSSLVASVQAIEVLLPQVNGGTPCSTCGRLQGGGPTASFKEFLDRNLGPDDSPVRKQLYKQRSRLVHGQALFSADEQIDFAGIHPHRSFENTSASAAINIARVAAINWFTEQLRTAGR
jgi:hypothetical protein